MGDRLNGLAFGLIIVASGYGLCKWLRSWGDLIGIAIMIFGVLMIISAFTSKQKKYYCADCGQFLGNSPCRCDRCGCNRYTTHDPL